MPNETVQNESELKLIYFSGTSTTDDQSIEAFPALKAPGAIVIDGVGTEDHSKTVLNHEHHPSRVNRLHEKIDALKTAIKGYKSEDHVGQIEKIYDPIAHMLGSGQTNLELTLMGHSRGAAGGVTGCIALMYGYTRLPDGNPAKERCKEALMKMSKIRCVFIDPVAGPSGNDLLGLRKNSSNNPHILRDMIKDIETLAGKKLFDMQYIFARYDSRKQFEVCPIHQDFVHDPRNNAKMNYVGFQHSAMLETDPNNIAAIYPDPTMTPTTFVNARITEVMGKTPGISSEEILKGVNQAELKVIKDIRAKVKNPATELALTLTSRKGYELPGQVATHTDFKSAVTKRSDDAYIELCGRIFNADNFADPFKLHSGYEMHGAGELKVKFTYGLSISQAERQPLSKAPKLATVADKRKVPELAAVPDNRARSRSPQRKR
ncbi:hypothetical protein [Abyssalbus ytuae]|uniref:Uncharacterized protein n=1 Tax=Abyssalbus ytuae TaxID=2926907 RepID=A0A9E6ZTY2_9FLAO|nr:hypothetical protein [Abyssalbus ytuae]UOB16651.1 hypothetical protein MQE35_13005 [Abyssalbus ytuae]